MPFSAIYMEAFSREIYINGWILKIVFYCIIAHLCYNQPLMYFSLLSAFLKMVEKVETCRSITRRYLCFKLQCSLVVLLCMVSFLTQRIVDCFKLPMMYVTFKYSFCSFLLAMFPQLCKEKCWNDSEYWVARELIFCSSRDRWLQPSSCSTRHWYRAASQQSASWALADCKATGLWRLQFTPI